MPKSLFDRSNLKYQREQYILRQMVENRNKWGCHYTSNGGKLLEGEDLNQEIYRNVHRGISKRAGAKNADFMRDKNIHFMLRTRRQTSEDPGTFEFLANLVLHGPVSPYERKKVARRILRKAFPERWAQLSFFNKLEARERGHWDKHFRENKYVVSQDLDLGNGMSVSEGTELWYRDKELMIKGSEVVVPFEYVRKANGRTPKFNRAIRPS